MSSTRVLTTYVCWLSSEIGDRLSASVGRTVHLLQRLARDAGGGLPGSDTDEKVDVRTPSDSKSETAAFAQPRGGK